MTTVSPAVKPLLPSVVTSTVLEPALDMSTIGATSPLSFTLLTEA